MTGALTIAPPIEADRAGWEPLYLGYREHYKQPPDARAADAVWSWITDPDGPLHGLIAKTADGRVVGMAHFREVPRPLRGAFGGYLDDIFVAEEARGSGVAEALLDAIATHGRARGWVDVRWLTADDNYRARGFYDRVAQRSMFLTYEIKL